jgi:aldehyde dehydrogenase
MLHQVIETLNSRVALRPRYENFIGGKWVAPVSGGYFENISPVTGKPVCEIARSQAADIELALDAAHKAKDAWGHTAPAKRAEILNRIADRMEENLKVLAAVETIDNGKPIRETTFADNPSPSIISAISRPASVPRKDRCRRSTRTRSPITITSRSAWSARSSRGTSRS